MRFSDVLRTSMLLASTLVLGCESLEHFPWELDRARVLAMRVEVAGDEARSTPAPGERARVRALVVDPRGANDGEVRWAFAACLASAETRTGLACSEPPFARADGAGEPLFELDTPPEERHLLVSGIVCFGGTPIASDAGFGCDGARDEEEVVLVLSTSRTTRNHHPVVDRSPTLGGEPWPEGAGCADERTLRWAASHPTSAIAWDLGSAAREPAGEHLEELLVSHAATHGELDRYYSRVEHDESGALVEVDYTPPPLAEIPATGLDVALVFVVRDERGGAAWMRRTLCVTPE